ncbi:MAG: flagellar hook-basal body complex protein [Firmicutes bacterium]|nr:flagellar hook-basal body complex protein [Bacillota bacterium]
MIRGLYSATTGMLVQKRKQENVSENLANLNTNSYKKQQIINKSFNEMYVKNRENGGLDTIGTLELGTEIDEVYTDFTQGLLNQTNKNKDFAIDGNGFFTIEGDGELLYTRDGNFKVDSSGRLTTKQGYPVLAEGLSKGDDGYIYVKDKDISVNENGEFKLDGNERRFMIVDFNDKALLEKRGENIYSSEENPTAFNLDTKVKQGYLEKSNIDPLEEMVRMIEITRNFESNYKTLQSIDDTLGKAVNEVGRIR